MASLTQWTWVCVASGSWWWTGKPGVLQSMGMQRVRHHWATEMTACPIQKSPFQVKIPQNMFDSLKRISLKYIDMVFLSSFIWKLVKSHYKEHMQGEPLFEGCPLWHICVLSCSVKSKSLWSHGLQTRLHCPWDFPGKNTGVGCHYLLQRRLLDPGTESISHVFPALAGGFFTTAPDGYWWVKFCASPSVASSLPLIHLYVTISLKLLFKIYVTSEIFFRHVDPSLWCHFFFSKSSALMTLGMSLIPGRQCSGGQ